jgi:hypothetical protein
MFAPAPRAISSEYSEQRFFEVHAVGLRIRGTELLRGWSAS